MGPDPGSTKWNELAWPGKAGQYDALQQHEDAALLLKDNEFSDVALRGHHATVTMSGVSAEGQQQQQGSTSDCTDHGPFAVGQTAAEPSESAAGVLMRPIKQLTSVVWQNGYVCMLVAAFTFSLSVLCVKLTGSRVPVLQITLARSTLSFIISTAVIKARGIKPMFGQRKHAVWLIGRGVSGAFAMMTFYVAILKLPLADANTLFFLNPCMTAVAAWAFLGEPLGLVGACGCLLSLLGLVVLTHPPMLFGGHTDWGPQRIAGTAFGVVSAVGATGAFICIRFVGKAEPAIVVALSFHTSTMVMSALPLAVGYPQPAAWLGWWDCLLLVGVAATSFWGQLSLTRGFQLLDAGKAAGLNFSQVLWGYIFGILLFGERLTLFGVLGTCLIAVGMGCVTARTKAQPQSEKSATLRDLAGAGVGSVLLPVRQQHQQQGPDGDLPETASFLARHLSFQRLLRADREEPDLTQNSSKGSDQINQQLGSSDADSLLLHVQQPTPAADQYGLQPSHVRDVLPGELSRDPTQTPSGLNSPGLVAVSERWSQQRQSSNTYPLAAAAAAGGAELVPLGHIQHRHQPPPLQQQQQQQGPLLQFSGASPAPPVVAVQQLGHSGDAAAAGQAFPVLPAAATIGSRQMGSNADGIGMGSSTQHNQDSVRHVRDESRQQEGSIEYGRRGLVEVPLGQ